MLNFNRASINEFCNRLTILIYSKTKHPAKLNLRGAQIYVL